MSSARSTAILVAILAVGFSLRLLMAARTPFLYDEYRWAAIIDRVDLSPASPELPLHGDQHPAGQVYWGAAGVALLGHNLLGYRFSSVLLGTLAIWLIYRVGSARWGRFAGLVAAALLCVSEYHIGISRTCTEKGYLTFALLAIVALDRVLRRPDLPGFLFLGGSLGLGVATKQTLILWVPVLVVFLGRKLGWRRLFGSGAAWAGAAVLLAAITPDLVWNLGRAPAGAGSPSDVGILYQLSRLDPGTWSWGPLALYLRPLYFLRVEGTISEYASLTTVPGALVLASAVASLFVLTGDRVRVLQVLGFATFAFFAVASNPRGEFWWADLTLPVFLLLTAGLASSVTRFRGAIAAALAVVFIAPGVRVAVASENWFPLEWGAPSPGEIERYRTSQKLMITRFRDRDHVALCRIGGRELPPARYYAAGLDDYVRYLEALAGGDRGASWRRQGWPPVARAEVEEELRWARRELARLRGAESYST